MMNLRARVIFCGVAAVLLLSPLAVQAESLAQESADSHLWLEEVAGERQLDWVRAQNAVSQGQLENALGFAELRTRLQGILDSKDKIPYVARHGDFYYNFWRDDQHVRGLWRRTTLEEYRKATPAWETVLDLDALGAAENENWVWKGATVLLPTHDRALLLLSRGGADAVVTREFDLVAKRFVTDGFVLPEAKSDVSWFDRDTLWVSTDFGAGSLTESGYPRITRAWKRGTPLDQAEFVSEGDVKDVAAGATVVHDRGRRHEVFQRALTFFTQEAKVRRDGAWVRVRKPDDAELAFFHGQAVLRLRSAWTVGAVTHPAGALIATDLESLLREGEPQFDVLYVPSERTALESFIATKNGLVLCILDNVRHRLEARAREGTAWRAYAIEAPEFAVLEVGAVDPEESDQFWLQSSNLLTPPSLLLASAVDGSMEKLKSMPAFFDASGLVITQHDAISKDGTRVPYFQVARMGLKADGTHPTRLYGYGGFEVSELPDYRATLGAGWLERGGVAVVANIRGGGEFGPAWHNAARRENRQRAYDDFIAVAEDLIARKITSPAHLGIHGGSNGGLLMGVMLTQRPDLFGAIACAVPLLDMRRYTKLLAGASWADEYGDPDVPSDWEFIRAYSPYHNVKAGVTYPPILFTTSTRDDRVHPGHARKMHALLKAHGQDSLLYENIEGGHGGAATNAQAAHMLALTYTFLWERLK